MQNTNVEHEINLEFVLIDDDSWLSKNRKIRSKISFSFSIHLKNKKNLSQINLGPSFCLFWFMFLNF